ncbi:hypothetical protein [Mesorhizobium sp.]|uniref:hypothetical protein n=1 Tax=Mesorhizobium sp. TaxID=1871066 RepID=UPI000FE480FF|nr:hypothetical protein [Mesorhizobium sp.]RWD81319.1 MAG: hypothetical protein EOS48_16670 [Mesorhizobium sp.]
MLATFEVAVPQAVAADEYVVISAAPPTHDLPPGKLLTARDVIDVPAGTSVVLLGEDGSINPINGPATFVVVADALRSRDTADPASANTSTISLIAQLLANERDKTEIVGGSRNPADVFNEGRFLDPWSIPIEESAPGCIRDRELILERQRTEHGLMFSVRFDDRPAVTRLIWSAGEAIYSLDEPIPHGAKELSVEASGTSTRIEIKMAPAGIDLDNPVELLGWMITSGCTRQALASIRQIAH